MNIIKIKPNITTCYLIPNNNKYILIDTGYENDKDKFYKTLSQKGINISDINYILLTHSHDDHAGLINDIVSQSPECRVILHKNAVKKLTTGENDLRKSKYINKPVAAAISIAKKFTKGGFTPYKTRENDIIIHEDTTFYQLGIDIPGKILYTPGHTDDSISIVLDDGKCFCGDAAANMLTILQTNNCVIVVDDINEYYNSWEKLLDENITKVYPAHGNSFKAYKLKENINKNINNTMPSAYKNNIS